MRSDLGQVTQAVIVACIAFFLADHLELSLLFFSHSTEPGSFFDFYSPLRRLCLFDLPSSPYLYWRGLYTEALVFLRDMATYRIYTGPVFEKMQAGELWRMVSPALLHGSLMHIAFNLLWFYQLAPQMERSMGSFRFGVFIFASAACSNLAQYLMSGFQFLGLSGVVCATLAFVAFRMKKAPWEPYMIAPSSARFLFIFVFGLAGLQGLAFAAQVLTGKSMSLGIANTAHIAGLAFGYLAANYGDFFAKEDRA